MKKEVVASLRSRKEARGSMDVAKALRPQIPLALLLNALLRTLKQKNSRLTGRQRQGE